MFGLSFIILWCLRWLALPVEMEETENCICKSYTNITKWVECRHAWDVVMQMYVEWVLKIKGKWFIIIIVIYNELSYKCKCWIPFIFPGFYDFDSINLRLINNFNCEIAHNLLGNIKWCAKCNAFLYLNWVNIYLLFYPLLNSFKIVYFIYCSTVILKASMKDVQRK